MRRTPGWLPQRCGLRACGDGAWLCVAWNAGIWGTKEARIRKDMGLADWLALLHMNITGSMVFRGWLRRCQCQCRPILYILYMEAHLQFDVGHFPTPLVNEGAGRACINFPPFSGSTTILE